MLGVKESKEKSQKFEYKTPGFYRFTVLFKIFPKENRPDHQSEKKNNYNITYINIHW